MLQTSFPVEYDFKRAKLDLIDKKTGKIKNKYKCLPLMITVLLSKPLNPLGPPNQSDKLYKQTIVKSISSTDSWLNFIPLENKQPNIITIEPNTLFINNFSYNYDIIVDVINKGKDNVDLRFMAENPFSLLASNMNDLNLDETIFSNIHNGQRIKFTITGEYQFFYVNYPTTNFDLNITIIISNTKTPVFICNDKCQNCTCFDIKGNGYIKLKNKGEFIYVPVYITRVIGNSINKYLYPEFDYLRDLFNNITLANSLTPPSLTLQNLISDNPIIKFLTTTVINCIIGNEVEPCSNTYWGLYVITSGDLVKVSASKSEIVSHCPSNQIYEQNTSKYRYSWGNTPVLATSQKTPDFDQDVFFGVYLWYLSAWWEFRRILLSKKLINGFNNYSLSSGSYDNLTEYKWIKFGLIAGTDIVSLSVVETQPSFDITITEI